MEHCHIITNRAQGISKPFNGLHCCPPCSYNIEAIPHLHDLEFDVGGKDCPDLLQRHVSAYQMVVPPRWLQLFVVIDLRFLCLTRSLAQTFINGPSRAEYEP